MKYIVLIAFLFCLNDLVSQEHRPEIHCKHFIYGYPYGTPETNDLIIRDVYALSNNDSTKFADWVAYRLTGHEVDGDLAVDRKWKADPWLAEDETLEPSPNDGDYKKARDTLGVDRGHQAPLASFAGSRNASHTNYLSNITPQQKTLNQQPWKNLEGKVRELVLRQGHTYVMTGPLYEEEMKGLPFADEPHVVPSGYWKVVCQKNGASMDVAAFIFHQNTGSGVDLADFLKTVDEVESRSGLDFFWELDDAIENELEGEIDIDFATKLLN